MRKFLYTNRILLILIFFTQTSCEGVFIPDPIDPRIPKYTDNGNNVAGALINDTIWKSVVTHGFPYNPSNQPSISVWQDQDSLILTFSGNLQGMNVSLEFHLKGLGISKFEDLIDLDKQKISLDGISNTGYYIEHYNTSPYSNGPSAYKNKGVGQIYFKNVCFDDSSTSIILSGTFSFTVNNSNDQIIKVSSGRFDYKINHENFSWFDDY